tara:strand:- start:1087 stop:2145 length:1059 start_codon:yes stop_codon:yes gene_type:complete
VIIKSYNLIIRTFFRALSLIVQILHKLNVLEHGSIINLNFLYRYPSPGISREMRKQKKKKNDSLNIVSSLVDDGYCKLNSLSKQDVKSAINFFNKKKIFNRHQEKFSDKKKININDFLKDKNSTSNYASFSQKDTISFLNKHKILEKIEFGEIIKNYFDGKRPKLFSAETMISKKSEFLQKFIQTFHRDYDSVKTLVLFIYWTKTNSKNGSTQVIKGSHLQKDNNYIKKKIVTIKKNHFKSGLTNSNSLINKKIINEYFTSAKTNVKNSLIDEKKLGKKLISLHSNPGDIYLMDASCLHRGSPEIKNPRLVTWLRFSYYMSSISENKKNDIYSNAYKVFNNKFRILYKINQK